jgi:glyoxylase-like metal-dependent hydrolase (beta-lactamase superfamily II)
MQIKRIPGVSLSLHRARRSLLASVGQLGLSGLAGLAWSATASAQEPVRAQEVAPGVWIVQGVPALGSPENRNFISNAGFVVTDDGVIVVDALGSPALAHELLAEIRRVTPQPVRHVVVTHYRADHIYGLQVFREAGATILAHCEGRDYLASDRFAGAHHRIPAAPNRSRPRTGVYRPLGRPRADARLPAASASCHG